MEGQCRERWGEWGAEILVVTGGRSRVFLLRIGERPRRDVGPSKRNPGEEVAGGATRRRDKGHSEILEQFGVVEQWGGSSPPLGLQKRG